MKIILALLVNLLFIFPVFAELQVVTDREIVMLFDSTKGEETALRSLLPTDQFKLKVTVKDLYTIIDRESPEYDLPGYEYIHKYGAEGCLKSKNRNEGLCLSIWLSDSETNKQKLRTLKIPESTPEFIVALWSISEMDQDGVKFKVLNFAEKKP